MEITLLGYKFNLEVLILIGIIYLILVTNTVCSCCNMPKIFETMQTLTTSLAAAANSV
jgi:hypothetical protein